MAAQRIDIRHVLPDGTPKAKRWATAFGGISDELDSRAHPTMSMRIYIVSQNAPVRRRASFKNHFSAAISMTITTVPRSTAIAIPEYIMPITKAVTVIIFLLPSTLDPSIR
jgi:hypothetical protein